MWPPKKWSLENKLLQDSFNLPDEVRCGTLFIQLTLYFHQDTITFARQKHLSIAKKHILCYSGHFPFAFYFLQ